MTPTMTRQRRALFDRVFEHVLKALPKRATALLAALPVLVEDYPAQDIMDELGLGRRDELCGLYTGSPMTQHSYEATAEPSDAIHIYREGILAMASDRGGRIDEHELHEQIRITVLHELGHYHGLEEDDLDALGY